MDILSDIGNFFLNILASVIPLFSEENRLSKKKNRLIKKQKNLTLRLEIKALEESITEDKKKLEGVKDDKN